ncbi:MAG: glycerophosphodiester phosphodiesterase, partial [Clostridia bacterium]|nr:glycerophosphodiester phosphodiesterase [Clostridia bacterium]
MNTIKINSNGVKMIAHRGLSGIERENTCPAFVAAGNRSYFGIETDVHITKDGKFVIIHDETTERISSGKHSINVEESDYSEVERIVLPDLDSTTDRKDIRIPLLREYIKICKKYEK